jgi:hypothetical protein
MRVKISVKKYDALNYECDVLGLKYAQGLSGVDWKVFDILEKEYPRLEMRMPAPSSYYLTKSVWPLKAK